MRSLEFVSPVTFFVGENGSGKSTLLEAIAMAAGINPEGGSLNLRFSVRPTESALHNHLRMVWSARPRWAYFLRAESFFNTASAYEDIGFGGLHRRSHGEQFIDVALSQFREHGFHLMDEPEAALSLGGQLRLLRRMWDLAAAGAQFIVATHSPILLAFPGAAIFEFSPEGPRLTTYEESEPYQLTKSFLDAPERFLRHLFTDE